MSGTDPDLYDSDFFVWLQQQTQAVRAGDWDAIDRENLAEEIESITRHASGEGHASGELRKHLDHLLVWFLASVYAPAMRDDHLHWYVRVESLGCEIETIVDVWPPGWAWVSAALAS